MSLIHRALMYDGTDEFLATTVPFVREGLATNNAAVVVAREPNLSALRSELSDCADLVDFYESERFYLHPVRTLKSYLQVVDLKRPQHVYAVAEPYWYGHEDWELTEWIRYESLINVVFQDSGASSVCPYNVRELPDSIIEQALRTHPALLEGGAEHPSDKFVAPAEFSRSCDLDRRYDRPPDAAYHPIVGDDLQPLRAFVANRAEAFGLDRTGTQNLVTAANEVAANALRHGCSPMAAWMWSDGDVFCEVGDNGHWQPDSLTGFVPPKSALEQGFGLWTVRLLVDLVELRGGWGGTFVRMRVRR